MTDKRFDYVIIGAGSAGCVLANRLSEDPDVSVLLLEAGGRDLGWKIHMPAALAYPLADDKVNWYYHSEPEPHMDGRRLYCPRGKVIGGSSSINGMAYVRGHARDYDRWAADGLDGWDYAHCLPYFRKAEHHELGADDYHGTDGPLKVTAGEMRNPLFRAWLEAGRQAGYPISEDMNGHQQEGLSRMDRTCWKGERWSAAKGYLDPARSRRNLTVVTRALVHRIVIEDGRATAVDYTVDSHPNRATAEREIVLSAGAINSPQILMLSGVGPADHLRQHGIDVVADLPGVGENLQDHLEVYVQHACTQPISMYYALKPWHQAWIGPLWFLTRKGPAASSHFEAGGFIRSRDGVEHPDLQYHFLPIAINYDGSNPAKAHGFQAHVGPMRPEARGHVRLKNADPRQAPEILFNYMASERDRQEMRDGVRLTREIFSQPAFEPYRGPEMAPGPEVESDAEIDAFVRQHGESAYHPSCTCKMGSESDPAAVVDAEGKVRGVGGLRVVDASIMPSIVSGNLNAPTIMLAEKLADAIRGADPLPPSEAPVWIHPEWREKQR